MKNRATILLLVLTLILSVAQAAFAEGIKDRMKARLPAIKALKAQGVVGENNQGFLQYLGSATPQKDVVDAENGDRQKVYEAIAKQQGVSAAVVGQRRALQIVGLADPGESIQNAAGQWYRK
ncbi:MAG: DUF1318 domain-containing protein [Desulfobacterales bacterium]|nr:DUF1318 domain-containing protein [Desulfobacterales bacterium]